MSMARYLSASGQKAFIICTLAAFVCAASGLRAGSGPRQTPAQAPAAPQADPFIFDSDSVLVILTVSAEVAPDVDAAMAKVKDVLAKSEKPERKQQAGHWRVTKSDGLQGGMQIYFMMIDAVVKNTSYSPFVIMLDGGVPGPEVKAAHDKIFPNIKGFNIVPVKSLVYMSGK